MMACINQAGTILLNKKVWREGMQVRVLKTLGFRDEALQPRKNLKNHSFGKESSEIKKGRPSLTCLCSLSRPLIKEL